MQFTHICIFKWLTYVANAIEVAFCIHDRLETEYLSVGNYTQYSKLAKLKITPH